MSPELLNAIASLFARWTAEPPSWWPALREQLDTLAPGVRDAMHARLGDAALDPQQWLEWLDALGPEQWEKLAGLLSELLLSLGDDHPLAAEISAMLGQLSALIVDALSGTESEATGELGRWLDAASAWCVDAAMRGMHGPKT